MLELRLTENGKVSMGVILKLNKFAQSKKVSLTELYAKVVPPVGDNLEWLEEVVPIICTVDKEEFHLGDYSEDEIFEVLCDFFTIVDIKQKTQKLTGIFFNQSVSPQEGTQEKQQ